MGGWVCVCMQAMMYNEVFFVRLLVWVRGEGGMSGWLGVCLYASYDVQRRHVLSCAIPNEY